MIIELLTTLRNAGIELSTKGGELIVKGKRQALKDNELLKKLKDNKQEIIDFLSDGEKRDLLEKKVSCSVPDNLIDGAEDNITPDMVTLASLDQAQIDCIVEAVPGGVKNIQDIYPLTPLQKGIYFHSISSDKNDVYLTPVLFKFSSNKKFINFVSALQAIVDRHDILRTAVVSKNLVEPMQVVWKCADITIDEIDSSKSGSALDYLKDREGLEYRKISLDQAPLLKLVKAYDKEKDQYLALLLVHHLVIDHSSLEILQSEINANLLNQGHHLAQPLPFRNFVAKACQDERELKYQKFFEKMLGDFDEPASPLDLTDIHGNGEAMSQARMLVSPELIAKISQLSRKQGITNTCLAHLAFALVLSKLSAKSDVVFGTLMLGRMHGEHEADKVMGPFVNTLPMRFLVDQTTVIESLRNTQKCLAELVLNEQAPLSLAQRCSSVPAQKPLFTSILNYRRTLLRGGDEGGKACKGAKGNANDLAVDQAWQGIDVLGTEEQTHYPFSVDIDDFGETLQISVQLQEPHDPDRMCQFIEKALRSIVDAVDNCPTKAIHELDVIPEAEQKLLNEWNATERDYPKDVCVHELFESLVEISPDAIAISDRGKTLSYGELNTQANILAKQLIDLGCCPESPVMLLAERGCHFVIGLLAILKAGGAYLPVDVSMPLDRIKWIYDDAKPQHILCDQAGRNYLAKLDELAPLILTFENMTSSALAPVDNINAGRVYANQLAYIIYTSGSTGKPKGVMIEHRSLVNQLTGLIQKLNLNQQDRFLQFSSIAFDVCVEEVLSSLCSGGTLVIRDDSWLEGAEVFWRLCLEHKVSIVDLPVQFWEQLASSEIEIPKNIRQVLVGGEAMSKHGLANWLCREGYKPNLLNVYGPTEATINATAFAPNSNDEWNVIGRPLANTRAYVLDQAKNKLPIGVTGELYLAGDGLARAYLNQAELSQTAFINAPFNTQERLYKTGDIVRWNNNGQLEFVGRVDSQVKIRGYRIELGEIESCVQKHSSVTGAVVVVHNSQQGKRLLAYIVGKFKNNTDGGKSELRNFLRQSLPDYMIPSGFIFLDDFPLTRTGKIDRNALPTPDESSFLTKEYAEPLNDTEVLIASLWENILGLEKVGRYDNFFELGGHSLLAIKLIEGLRERNKSVDIAALFTSPTLAAFAAEVDNDIVDDPVIPENKILVDCESITPEDLPLVNLSQKHIDIIVASVSGGVKNIQDIYPLAPLQEGILFHHLLDERKDPYLQDIVFTFEQRSKLDAFLDALQNVINRHDILRTAIVWQGLPEPVQVVWRDAPLAINICHVDECETEHSDQLALHTAPLLKAVVYEGESAPLTLKLLFHHLAADHTTLEVMQQEIQAFMLDEADVLPTPVPFRKFVAQIQAGLTEQDHIRYFTERLGDLSEPSAPFGVVDIHGDGTHIVEASAHISREYLAKLKRGTASLNVGVASVCHLAWALLLSRICGKSDVVFGTLLLGRLNAVSSTERALGLFINTLPLRFNIDNRSVKSALKGIHAELAALLRHEHASLSLAQQCSGIKAPTPLFSTLLNYRHSGLKHGENEEITHPDKRIVELWRGVEMVKATERTNYPLMINIDDYGDQGLGFTIQAENVAQADLVCTYMELALVKIIDAMAHPEAMNLHAIDVMPKDYRKQLIENWNLESRRDFPISCLHQLVEQQCRAYEEQGENNASEIGAVRFADRMLSYQELNQRANQLAHYLIDQGVQADDRVGLSVERSERMIIAMLGILKAGGAYVPMDPTYPSERLVAMLKDSQPKVVLTDGPIAEELHTHLESGVESGSWTCFDLQSDAHRWTQLSRDNIAPDSIKLGPDNLAYIIYTSGSTGVPKGVAIEHKQAANFVQWAQTEFSTESLAHTIFSTSLNFDLSIFECFVPLSRGTLVELVDNALSLQNDRDNKTQVHAHVNTRFNGQLNAQFNAQFNISAPTLINTVPSAIKALLESDSIPSSVTDINLAGEPLKQSLVEQLFARTQVERIRNLYGPSETTTYSTWVKMDRETGFLPHVGKAVANTQLYLLDGQGEPVPVGVVGELYIAGAGVARGYLHQEALTQARFIALPYGEGKAYRTGDIGRWDADGNLEYLGRNDFQVKIRGFRIELGEIESQLMKLPGVNDVVVVASSVEGVEDIEGADQSSRLIAYIVASEMKEGLEQAGAQTEIQAKLHVDSLREQLSKVLPDYMIPSAFMLLTSLPLTANGKVDRKRLPAPDASAYQRREYEAPEGEVETHLAALWSVLLGVEKVGRHDNFFELGGHSLLAMRLIAMLRENYSCEIAMTVIFSCPHLHSLAREISRCERNRERSIVSIPRHIPPRAPGNQDLPLSYVQQRIWFLSQMENQSRVYHMPMVHYLKGELDVQALKESLDFLVQRHESLRTRFDVVRDEPVQKVDDEKVFQLAEHDLRASITPRDKQDTLLRISEKESLAPFDLAAGPLIRGQLVRAEDDEYLLLITMHHIISDATSLGIFLGELTQLYNAKLASKALHHAKEEMRKEIENDINTLQLPELPIQYADYALWQKQRLSSDVLRAQAKFWQTTLEGAPAQLQLPTDYKRPSQQNTSGANFPVLLDPKLSADLKRLSEKNACTLFMTLLAAWSVLLGRLAGQNDIVIGTPVSNRDRIETEGIIGFFVNTLAIRVSMTKGITTKEILGLVKTRVLEAQENKDLPFEQIVELVKPERSLAYTPIFQVMFSWQAQAGEGNALNKLELLELAANYKISKYDLTLNLSEFDKQIVGDIEYATALFEESNIERIQRYFTTMLREMVKHPEQAIDSINLLGEEEYTQQLIEWNATYADYPKDRCVHQVFAAQVDNTPDAEAVIHGDTCLTYRELDTFANTIANRLIHIGVKKGDAVAISMERSVDLVASELAILKCGAFYVPLDSNVPWERNKVIIEDCGAKQIIFNNATSLDEALLEKQALTSVNVDKLLPNDAAIVVNVRCEVNSDDPAYVMYTSGSTGKPKGVVIPHKAIGRIAINNGYANFDASDRIAFAANPAFDATTMEVWGALLNGACVVVFDRDVVLNPQEFEHVLIDKKITTLFLTTALFNQFTQTIADALGGLRYLLCGGERNDPAAFRRLSPNKPEHLIHCYGPTESTTFALTADIKDIDDDNIPIGKPISNTQVYILDDNLQCVPIGCCGELYIGGMGLAKGYLNKSDLTALNFIDNPFVQGEVLYKTGDLAKYQSDGNIVFVGRNDHQVKIRGFRIELGEVESLLLQHDGVDQVLVTTISDEHDSKRLIAYVTLAGNPETLTPQDLRFYLLAKSPEHMVPSAFVILENMPLNANGKIDRKKLPSPKMADYARPPYEEPEGEDEMELASVLKDLLEIERVGRQDNFFELGGHSLLVTKLITRIEEKFDVRLEVQDIFKGPTLSAISECILDTQLLQYSDDDIEQLQEQLDD